MPGTQPGGPWAGFAHLAEPRPAHWRDVWLIPLSPNRRARKRPSRWHTLAPGRRLTPLLKPFPTPMSVSDFGLFSDWAVAAAGMPELYEPSSPFWTTARRHQEI